MILPNYFTSPILDFPQIEHRFFEKINDYGEEIDFSAPLDVGLAQACLEQLKLEKLLFLNQNHTAHVVCYPSHQGAKDADGMITNVKNVGLFIRHADCQAALFFDPVTNVIAAVHAGYRGQIQKIYSQTVNLMTKYFGVDPKNLRVAISASLSFPCAEFKNFQDEFPHEMHRFQKDMKMDLKALAVDELISLGLKKQQIDMSSLCTYLDQKAFYSYRLSKTKKRLASFIVLR